MEQMEQWRERLEGCLGEWVAITATRDHAPPQMFEQTSFWGRVGGVRGEHVSIVNTDLTTDRIHLADIRTMRRSVPPMDTNTNELTDDELTLLAHIHQAGEPVEANSFFAGMNAETGRRATERQVELYEAYVSLWQRGLVEAAVPADGLHADRMVPTEAGVVALRAAGEVAQG